MISAAAATALRWFRDFLHSQPSLNEVCVWARLIAGHNLRVSRRKRTREDNIKLPRTSQIILIFVKLNNKQRFYKWVNTLVTSESSHRASYEKISSSRQSQVDLQVQTGGGPLRGWFPCARAFQMFTTVIKLQPRIAAETIKGQSNFSIKES